MSRDNLDSAAYYLGFKYIKFKHLLHKTMFIQFIQNSKYIAHCYTNTYPAGKSII